MEAALGGGSFTSAFTFAGMGLAGTAGAILATGGGRRFVRRLTFLLVVVPYIEVDSRGSSDLTRPWTSRVMSDNTCRSLKVLEYHEYWRQKIIYLYRTWTDTVDMYRAEVLIL